MMECEVSLIDEHILNFVTVAYVGSFRVQLILIVGNLI